MEAVHGGTATGGEQNRFGLDQDVLTIAHVDHSTPASAEPR
jgi:hypothetical protein